MVFPYYPRPEDDEQEPTEEHQPEASQPAIPSYLYDVFAYMGEVLSLLYPPAPTSDESYVTPGKPHTLPSGPTTHPDRLTVSTPENPLPPTVGGSGYVMPGVALDPSTGQAPSPDSGGQDSIEVAPDLVSEREITEANVLKFCEYICEKDEASSHRS